MSTAGTSAVNGTGNGPVTATGNDTVDRTAASGTNRGGARRHTAGIFDVRNIIGALLGIYGVVLTIMGFTSYDATAKAKTDNVNLNLWTGLGLLVVGIGMIAWALLRPIVVDDDQVQTDVAAAQREH